MAYSQNIKGIASGLNRQGRSPEQIADVFSNLIKDKRDVGFAKLREMAGTFSISVTDADWQELIVSVPLPSTIRRWFKNQKLGSKMSQGLGDSLTSGGSSEKKELKNKSVSVKDSVLEPHSLPPKTEQPSQTETPPVHKPSTPASEETNKAEQSSQKVNAPKLSPETTSPIRGADSSVKRYKWDSPQANQQRWVHFDRLVNLILRLEQADNNERTDIMANIQRELTQIGDSKLDVILKPFFDGMDWRGEFDLKAPRDGIQVTLKNLRKYMNGKYKRYKVDK